MQSRPPSEHEPRRCRLCGEQRPLTFEHIPPRSAHNRAPAAIQGIETWLARDSDPNAVARRPQVQQRGSGAYSLCGPCNNLAGRLYVPEFRHWIEMGTTVLFGPDDLAARFRDERETAYATVKLKQRRPARFVKQIATMLLAMSPPGLGDNFPELRAYAADPNAVGFPDRLRLYLALYAGPHVRYAAGAATVRNFLTTGTEIHHVYELAYPPFSYILSLEEQTPVIETGNASNFGSLRIDQSADVELQMIVGYGETPLPLDLRSPAALTADTSEREPFMPPWGGK
ncbi:MAG: hypothetical protein H0X28_01390 [Solirubrobacterales bacterium]|nr:hypothetical protein [Solirubrobacterales bacterium]